MYMYTFVVMSTVHLFSLNITMKLVLFCLQTYIVTFILCSIYYLIILSQRISLFMHLCLSTRMHLSDIIAYILHIILFNFSPICLNYLVVVIDLWV